jgi:protocatechuate 3,4-dioxygenase beta subunit
MDGTRQREQILAHDCAGDRGRSARAARASGKIAGRTMTEQRRGLRWLAGAASLVLAAALVWWLTTGGGKDTAALADGSASPSEPPTGSGEHSSPSAAKPDFELAPKAGISGMIRDVEGNPISDAQVCAVSDESARRGVPDPEPHCVRSGPDGRYAIDDLFAIDTEVHASAASFQPARWERREHGVTRSFPPLRAGQITPDIDITLQPGGVLVSGVVKDIAGGEIEGAQLTIYGPWGGSNRAAAHAVSGAEGRFAQWVAPGVIVVRGQARGYALAWVTSVAPGQFVELYLTPESVLVGKVVLASTGEPVVDAEVSSGGRGLWQFARSDANGRFRIDGLQPGTYKPSASGETLYGEAAEQVHVGFGETSEEVVIRMHPAVHVEGRVVIAGTERPCPEGSVRLDNGDAGTQTSKIDDEGHVEFRALLRGTYSVRVQCTNHLAEEEYPELVAEHSVDGLVWEVREGLAIRGEVVDEAGNPVAQVHVEAEPLVDPDAARSRTTRRNTDSSSDGSFELAGLLAGRYELSTSAWRGRPGSEQPITVELEPGADVNDVRIVMPAVGTIRGRIVDQTGKPVAKAQIHATRVGGRGRRSVYSNDAGEFVIEELLAGETRVTASTATLGQGVSLRKPGTTDDDIQGELVEVVANEVVELTLTVESLDGRLSGVVVDEGGGSVADAFIDVERMSESAEANATIARHSVRWGWDQQPVLTDADGRFEVDGLPEGKFVVRANRKGGGEALAEGVALGSHVELVIASTGELAGTVKLADGSAPERFAVSIFDKAQGIHVVDRFFRTDGTWRFAELPAGSYEISASASMGNAALESAIALGEGETHEGIELVLSSKVTLRGRVIDLDTREPVAGVEIRVFGSLSFGQRNGDSERLNVSAADGRFEVADVSVGKVELVAWPRGRGREAKYDYFRKPLTLAAEPAVQDLGDVELIAKRLDPEQSLGDLGYTVARWDPATELSDWKPVIATVRAGGPGDAAGLVVGDVIAKVDGHTVQGEDFSRYRTLTTVAEGTVLVLVLEGGRAVELVAGPPIR